MQGSIWRSQQACAYRQQHVRALSQPQQQPRAQPLLGKMVPSHQQGTRHLLNANRCSSCAAPPSCTAVSAHVHAACVPLIAPRKDGQGLLGCRVGSPSTTLRTHKQQVLRSACSAVGLVKLAHMQIVPEPVSTDAKHTRHISRIQTIEQLLSPSHPLQQDI